MANAIERDEKITSSKRTDIIKRLLKYLNPYKGKSIIVILLMVFVMLCGIINPYLLKIAIDEKVPKYDIKGIIIIGLSLLSLNILPWILSKIRWSMIYSITNNILVNIRHQLYSHRQRLSFDFFDKRPVGKILARVVGDVNALKNLFNQSIQSLIPELLNLILVAVAMIALNVKLALICILLLPPLAIAMFYIEINSRKRWEIYRSKRSNLNAFTHEEFSGIKVVQAFAKEDYTSNKFKNLVFELKQAFNRAVQLNDFFWPLVEIFSGIATVVVFAVGYRLSLIHIFIKR